MQLAMEIAPMNEFIGYEIKPIEMGFRQPASAGLEASHRIHLMD
jgi:hypothetical protein